VGNIMCELCGADSDETFLTVPRVATSVPLTKSALSPTSPAIVLVRCRQCGLIYLKPRPSAKQLASYYDDTYHPFQQEVGWLWKALRRFAVHEHRRFLTGYVRDDGIVLEVGCGTGEYLALLREETGWQVEGVEPSQYAAKKARQQYGLPVTQGSLEDSDWPPDTYSVIILRHVLEHFRSPRAALAKLRRALRPGGALLIIVPNIASWEAHLFGPYWYDLDVPRHLTHFTPTTLHQMLHQEGFIVRRSRFSGVPNGWVGSVGRWLKVHRAPSPVVRFFGVNNPLALALFAPLSLLLSVARRGGRLEVLAERGPE